jgi:imidazolonepropionase-like amidohydrolase
VYDLNGRVVIPGFIDMHAHANTASVFLDAAPNELQAYLSYGITTVRDPSSGGDYAFSYSEMIDAGIIEGPRLFNTVGLLANMHRINVEQDAVDLVTRFKSMGATMIKLHTGWNRNQRQWIIAAARNQGLNVVAHQADSYVFQARADLSQIADGVTSVEHQLVLESLPYRDVMAFVEQVGTGHTPTHLATVGGYHRKYWTCLKADPRFARYPPSREPAGATSTEACTQMDLASLDEPAASLSRVSAASALSGGTVLVGSHGNYDGIGFHWELWAHAQGGLTAHQALRLATLGNARGLGMDQEIGSIEVGKIADMVVLDGDPLADIKNTLKTVNVIKAGVIYDPITLQEVGEHVH